MKVKDLIEEIERCKKEYPDFLEWDVYTEQISRSQMLRIKDERMGYYLTDSEDWEYFECAGFWTIYEKEKIFTINVNI